MINRKGFGINLKKKKAGVKAKEGINKHAKKRKHMGTHGNEDACKGKESTSNSSTSSNMGRVVEVSSLAV